MENGTRSAAPFRGKISDLREKVPQDVVFVPLGGEKGLENNEFFVDRCKSYGL